MGFGICKAEQSSDRMLCTSYLWSVDSVLEDTEKAQPCSTALTAVLFCSPKPSVFWVRRTAHHVHLFTCWQEKGATENTSAKLSGPCC